MGVDYQTVGNLYWSLLWYLQEVAVHHLVGAYIYHLEYGFALLVGIRNERIAYHVEAVYLYIQHIFHLVVVDNIEV